MPSITPFDLNPAQDGIDRLTAYWGATICKLAYAAPTVPRLPVWSLGGASSVQTVQVGGAVIPGADVGLFPGNKAVCAFQGTSSATQGALQVIGAELFPRAPWPGLVGNIHSALTQIVGAFIFPILTAAGTVNSAWYGHSLGASVAVLMADLSLDQAVTLTDCIFTIAAPRSGNITFALAQPYRHLRVTNAGDPIPMLPPSQSSVLDALLWLAAPVPLTSFWHAGTRAHLFQDGSAAFPPDQSTWADGSAILMSVAGSSSEWYTAHSTDEYARRIRIGIPIGFNVVEPAWPGLQELDQFWAEQPIDPPAAQWLDPVYCV